MENIVEALPFIEKYFLLFMMYSFGGWVIEEIHCSFLEKKIVNRGFLIGPICPIYGFGGTLITMILTGFQQNPIIVFGMSILVSAVLEYFTSYILEKIFNARWWDYSNDKYNLNGRICLRTIIPFGIFGLLVIYVINPYVVERLIGLLDMTSRHIVSAVLFTIVVIDTIVSTTVVKRITNNESDDKIQSIENGKNKKSRKDNTNEISAKVNEELKQRWSEKQRWLVKRFNEAFPNFTILDKVKKVTEKSREIIEKGTEKGKEAISRGAEKGKAIIEKGSAKRKAAINKGTEKGKKIVKKSKEMLSKKVENDKK